MPPTRQVVAVAGAGDLGRYLCEELLKAPDFDVIVITRTRTDTTRPSANPSNVCKWFSDPSHKASISVHETDYSVPSLLDILNVTNATTVVSFINISSSAYITAHASLLAACASSRICKRLIPSEWIGDSETHPLKPDFYATTREPFRHMLRAQRDVEWTLVNPGWLADYFLPAAKTHMSPLPDLFPVNVDRWRACLRRTGDEVQSWTCARDVARAVVDLCRAEHWEPVTYVAGEWSTFNDAIKVIENFYGRPMPRSYKTWKEIQDSLLAFTENEDMKEKSELAQIEEMMVMGCLACPKEKTLRQKNTYFSNRDFMDLETLLRCAEDPGVV